MKQRHLTARTLRLLVRLLEPEGCDADKEVEAELARLETLKGA